MNCAKCGAELEKDSRFCGVCGAPAGDVSAGQREEEPVPERQTERYQENRPGGSNYEELNTKRIRKWFKGRPLWPAVITVLAFLMALVMDEGRIVPVIIMLIGAAVWAYTWMGTMESDVQMVDMAWDRCARYLQGRGLEKLNLIQEQVSLIDPVVVTGRGESPNASFANAKLMRQSRSLFSPFGLIGAVIGLFRKDGTELDPYEAYRIAADEGLRSMLRQLTVYMFTDTQILIYKGNIDISTGMIYAESTDEVFYEDIEGMNFTQSVYKVLRKKRFVNKISEDIELYLGGCRLSSSIAMDAGKSVIDQQFAAMRNLIRDKKGA